MHIFGKKRILIIVGGNIEKIGSFSSALMDLPIDLTLASFTDLNYLGFGKKYHELQHSHFHSVSLANLCPN
jgi:hypothetical protein